MNLIFFLIFIFFNNSIKKNPVQSNKKKKLIMYIKRLMKEKEMNKNGFEYFYVQPLKDNILNWHFTFKGLEGTEYEGGLYHGCIKIPQDYPMNPPDIHYLNKSGRFRPNVKICITITSAQRKSWTPLWTFVKMLRAMIAHFITNDWGTGSMSIGKKQRKILAKKSRDYVCVHCGPIEDIALKYMK